MHDKLFSNGPVTLAEHFVVEYVVQVEHAPAGRVRGLDEVGLPVVGLIELEDALVVAEDSAVVANSDQLISVGFVNVWAPDAETDADDAEDGAVGAVAAAATVDHETSVGAFAAVAVAAVVVDVAAQFQLVAGGAADEPDSVVAVVQADFETGFVATEQYVESMHSCPEPAATIEELLPVVAMRQSG